MGASTTGLAPSGSGVPGVPDGQSDEDARPGLPDQGDPAAADASHAGHVLPPAELLPASPSFPARGLVRDGLEWGLLVWQLTSRGYPKVS
jgi:hypothetical protein